MSEIRDKLEAIYGKGNAILQYSVERDAYLARFRSDLYEVGDAKQLDPFLTHVPLMGLTTAPLAMILKLPNTRKIENITTDKQVDSLPVETKSTKVKA